MAWIEFKRGITREVFLIGGIVIKIPSFRKYTLFLMGILSNIQERRWTKNLKTDRICPVLFKSPLGLIIIMPRCKPSGLSWDEAEEKSKEFKELGIPVEGKPCSFGWYKDRLVAVDYGEQT